MEELYRKDNQKPIVYKFQFRLLDISDYGLDRKILLDKNVFTFDSLNADLCMSALFGPRSVWENVFFKGKREQKFSWECCQIEAN